MASLDHGSFSSSPPPQDRAAEMPEKGARDVPVHGRQQRGVPSAKDSREGAEGNSAFDARPRHKTIGVSRSNFGCMENVSLDGRHTAHTPPPEPMLSKALFREVASEPTVDSDVGGVVDEQSSSRGFTELGAQAAEALLSSEFSGGRTMIGETGDDSIDVEDWLDVAHAMLDTSVSGQDLE